MFALLSGLEFGLPLAAVAFFYALYRTKKATPSIWVALASILPVILIVWIAEYFANVAHTGFLGGYSYIVWAYALGLAAAGGALYIANSRDEDSSGGSGWLVGIAATSVVLLLVGWGITAWYCSVGTSANVKYAALANIRTAPHAEKPSIPDTDPNDMVQMDVHLAYTRAHQALGSGGNNLGSYYEIVESEGTQEWVAGRNWFVFPLELNGWMEQEGFMTQQRATSAGYIAVPADNPDGDVKIETGLSLKYMPGSYFGSNLHRYLYTHGYSDGILVDPTMENDDNWHPYFTVAYVQPAFVVGGHKIVKLLVVDPANGDIKEYTPDTVPAWVDRVTSEDMVTDWVGDYAKYSKVPDFWNSNGAGQMKVDVVRLVNTHGAHQVWQVPLLANKDNAISTNGIVLYDTRKAEGVFYESEGASGLGSSTTLKAAFENITQNTRGWHVEHIQWYSIQGVPTWMAIYAKEVATSGSDSRTVFAGIGFLDARNNSSADVQFATNRDEALENYKNWLSNRGANNGQVAESVNAQSLTGTVLRIGRDDLVNNQSIYTIVLKGDTRVFSVSRTVDPLMPVVREGDSISITFDEPSKAGGNPRRTITAFKDNTLKSQMTEQPKN